MATIKPLLQQCLLFFSFLLSYDALAQTSGQSPILEHQVKAAYLYKFASYVEWPDFIGHLEKPQLAEVFSEAKNKPLLTVTDSEETHMLGSMINFVVSDDRLRFEVALVPVNTAGLKISARMLAVAYKVTPVPS